MRNKYSANSHNTPLVSTANFISFISSCIKLFHSTTDADVTVPFTPYDRHNLFINSGKEFSHRQFSVQSTTSASSPQCCSSCSQRLRCLRPLALWLPLSPVVWGSRAPRCCSGGSPVRAALRCLNFTHGRTTSVKPSLCPGTEVPARSNSVRTQAFGSRYYWNPRKKTPWQNSSTGKTGNCYFIFPAEVRLCHFKALF